MTGTLNDIELEKCTSFKYKEMESRVRAENSY